MAPDDALNESYPAVAESVPIARRRLTGVASAAGVGGERLQEIRLAVSEALTNAVVHAYRNGPPGHFHVTAVVTQGELWVLIGDEGHGMHAWNDSHGLGLGLSLISGLSDDFMIVTPASGGTEVQMRFDLSRGEQSSPVINHEGRAARRPRQPDLASRR